MSINLDKILKIAQWSIVPLFIWVWYTNTKVELHEYKIGEMKPHTDQVEGISRDIKYIQEDIREVKQLLRETCQ